MILHLDKDAGRCIECKALCMFACASKPVPFPHAPLLSSARDSCSGAAAPLCWECPGHCHLCSGAGTGMAVRFLHLLGLSRNVLGCYPAVPRWCPESLRTVRRGFYGWRFWFVDWQERLLL